MKGLIHDLWQLIDGKRNLIQIGQEIERTFDVSPSVVEADMLEIRTGLLSSDLIVVEGEA